MKISHVHVENWRNFNSIDFPLADRLFIVGPNASGKSNLLDVLRFMADVSAIGLSQALARRGGLNRVRSLFARNRGHGQVTIDLELKDGQDRWRYLLSLRPEPRGHRRPLVAREIVEHNGNRLLDRPDHQDEKDGERLTQTYLEQINANQDFRDIADHFKNIQYFHLVPQVIRDAANRSSPEPNDPYGGDFIAQMNTTPKKRRDAWLRRIQNALQAAVPEFESLTIEVDKAGRPHLKAGYRNWRANPTGQYETEFSDGTLRLIGLLWTIVKAPRTTAAILLEEPELSLHSSVVSLLPSLFARTQRSTDMQIILSSHAPEVINDEGIDPEEILVLRVTKEGTTAELLSSITEVSTDIEDGILSRAEVVSGLITPPDVEAMLRVSEEHS